MQPTLTEDAAMSAITAACHDLRLPTVAAEAARLAEVAARERLTHRGYLAALRAAEVGVGDAAGNAPARRRPLPPHQTAR